MESVFRHITVDEISEGYQLIVERTNWLNQRGIQQWNKPIPETVLKQRQAEGNFYGYWVDGALMVVVCLLEHSVTDWGDKLYGRYLYLATLASYVAHAGQGYGSSCVMAACEYARQAGYERIYLDCVDNARALPNFYLRLGFQQIGEQDKPNGWRVILMIREL